MDYHQAFEASGGYLIPIFSCSVRAPARGLQDSSQGGNHL